MNKPYLLIVDDDVDIGNMLKIYFSGAGYDADIAVRGSDVLEKVRQRIPDSIICDIMLPDIDGYEVCRQLRTSLSTSQIPLIFLTQKDERSDMLQGLELGANDYISKPFDIEDLRLRVSKEIQWRSDFKNTHAITGLPSGTLLEKRLQLILVEASEWAVLDINIAFYKAFKEVYGFVAGDDILRFLGMLLLEEVHGASRYGDVLIGHVRGEHFIVCVKDKHALDLKEHLKARFAQEVLAYYNFIDRQQGFMPRDDPNRIEEKIPFMKLCIGLVDSSEKSFSNINAIVQLASSRSRDEA